MSFLKFIKTQSNTFSVHSNYYKRQIRFVLKNLKNENWFIKTSWKFYDVHVYVLRYESSKGSLICLIV